MYPHTETKFLHEGDFDHIPMILISHPAPHIGKKPFTYFPMWKSVANFDATVTRSWNDIINGNPMFKLVEKMKRLKVVLRQPNKEGYSNLQAKEIQASQVLKRCQEQLHQHPENLDLRRQGSNAARHHKIAHETYMEFLKQKAKCAWLKDGDSNSKLFHRSIKKRKCRIMCLAFIMVLVFGLINQIK